jgi:hypothetical protein
MAAGRREEKRLRKTDLLQSLVVNEASRILGYLELAFLNVLAELPIRTTKIGQWQCSQERLTEDTSECRRSIRTSAWRSMIERQ